MCEDRVAKAGLDAIMSEYAEDLAKKPPSGSYLNNVFGGLMTENILNFFSKTDICGIYLYH